MRTSSYLAKKRNGRRWFEDGECAIFAHPKKGDLWVTVRGLCEYKRTLLYDIEEVASGLCYPVDAKDLRPSKDPEERKRLLDAAKARGETRGKRQEVEDILYPSVPNLEKE